MKGPQSNPVPASEEIDFSPRGIGVNLLPCFICGEGEGKAQPDMASFVKDKASGERAVQMFKEAGTGVKLDYRDHEPNWVQVKVGACEAHRQNLERLMEEVRVRGNKLLPEIIEAVK